MNSFTRAVTLLLATLQVGSTADFIKGYTNYSASQLLESNTPGAAGELLFVDEAETGGSDLTANAGNPDWGFSISSSDWQIGDSVTFTGIALPIWANEPDSDNTSNTQNATWRIRFYSAGADNEWDGTANVSTTDDSFISSVDVEFTSADAGVGKYYAIFDSPVDWTADSSKIWFHCQAVSGKALRLKSGPGSALAKRESRVNGNTLNNPATLRMSLAGSVTSFLPEPDQLSWTPSGGGNNVSLYAEDNWLDLETNEEPSAGSVDPNTTLDTTLLIRKGSPGGGGGAGGNLLLGTGELVVSHATLRMNLGQSSGIDLGTVNRDFLINEAQVITHDVTNAKIKLQGHSTLTINSDVPLTDSSIDFGSSDAFVIFPNVLPGQINATFQAKFTVDGAPAVEGSNLRITQYYSGAIVRALPSDGVALRAFDGSNLTGQSWDFSPGFYGKAGLGFSDHNSGTYTLNGWGNDIWSNADQLHYLYRSLSGDGEIVARVTALSDTHFWAKAGLMIREDLTAGARNAFALMRPDNQPFYQNRPIADANTSVSTATGDTAADKWLRLTRAGNTFSAFYSNSSATGPWTALGSPVSVAMATDVLVGLAHTSHDGGERGTAVFQDVTILQGTTSLGSDAIGLFSAVEDVHSDWSPDDLISSFLLKKGSMVTVATDSGGQGTSQVYAATEDDLLVNLPTELDNQISFLRVVPWRWISKKGWAGTNNTFPNNIRAYWKYEWEPTGASTDNWEFVPMIKGRGQNADFRWEEVRVRGNQTHFLGFNEPEAANQGDLTVPEALALWPKAQQLGLRLGSPARTDGANGDDWLSSFMSQADTLGYRVDYVCVHNYNRTNAAGLKTWLDAEYAKYNRPIWLTEFQRDVDNDDPDSADHQAYLEEVIPMLETLPYLERYAYYNFNTANPSNNFASLFNNDDSPNVKGVFYRDFASQPSYRNLNQPTWATATLSPSGNGNLLNSSDLITATTSLTSAQIASVEFFANGISLGQVTNPPYSTPLASLPSGQYMVHSVVTTTFGETVSSPASEVFLTAGELEIVALLPNGQLTWTTLPGESYRIESNDDLIGPWTFVERRTASGTTDQTTLPNWGTPPANFFRVVWE
ncbi:MAG: glycosyl hydrolase [Roseibacillus sp.]